MYRRRTEMNYVISTNGKIIPHPGGELKALLKQHRMSQGDLARRVAVSPKHVSTVVNGLKRITLNFALKLEYVFPKTSKEWMRTQHQYDYYQKKYNQLSKRLDDFQKFASEVDPIMHRLASCSEVELSEDKLKMFSNTQKMLKFYDYKYLNYRLKTIGFPKDLRKKSAIVKLHFLIENLMHNTNRKFSELQRIKMLQEEQVEIDRYYHELCNISMYKYNLPHLSRTAKAQFKVESEVKFRHDRIISLMPKLYREIQMINENGLQKIYKWLELNGVLLYLLPKFDDVKARAIFKVEDGVIILGYIKNSSEWTVEDTFNLFYELATIADYKRKGVFIDFLVEDPYPKKKSHFIARRKLEMLKVAKIEG